GNVDGCADGVRRHRDVRRLVDRQRADEVRADRAEVNRATARGGREPTAVHQRLVEVAAKAANGDAVRFAASAIALDRNARQALKRGRDVRIGEVTDFLG